MNSVNNTFTTVSNRRTYIAVDKHYLGNVNSYNNWFTKFFAWMFRLSMTVDFNGEKRSVNKKSYKKLVQRLFGTDEKIENISQYRIFNDVAKKVDLSKNKMYMREAINSQDKINLFKKLALAITTGNTEKALRMIGKGAALDEFYFDRGKYKPSFESDSDNLSGDWSYKFQVFKGTPILVAAKKAYRAVVDRLKDFGAKTDVQAHEYQFKRKITGVSRSTTHESEFVDGNLIWKEVEHTYVHSEDGRKNDEYFVLDADLNLDDYTSLQVLKI